MSKQALVRAHLELLAALLVDVRRPVDREALDARRQRDRTPHLRARTLRRVHDLTRRRIENAMVERLESDADVLAVHVLRDPLNEKERSTLPSAPRPALCYSTIFVTTPAPTVRPPSRMAKRTFSSMAIGETSSTSTAMLSPGITISVPAGSVTTPVTSVVRK